ncbi:probable G-protein coupled receptor 34 [Hydra vulgaris]|uniref:Probable G-protein coupled receptor 34 n=1 Tax=Hydra vulgaris TaxID=6087 RepID=A0ABM4B917_HYDVU
MVRKEISLHALANTLSEVKESENFSLKIEAFNIFITTMLVFVMVVGLTGNTVVIYVFGVNRKKKRFERFLLSLGILDFLSSLIIPSTFLYLTVTGYKRWDFSKIGCKIIPTLLQISVSVTQGFLIMISYERYHSIVNPFKKKISQLKLILLFCIVLLVSFTLAIPYMMTFNILIDLEHGVNTCAPDGSKMNLSMIASSLRLLKDFVAISFMEFFRQRIKHSFLKVHTNSSWNKERETQKGRKILYTVIIVFSALTLPLDIFHFIYYMLSKFASSILNAKAYSVLMVVNTILNLFQMANSVVNVFIYSRLHKNFNMKQHDSTASCSILYWNEDKNIISLNYHS